MASKSRCSCCGGSGKVMGGGMCQVDCDVCDGYGKITIADDKDIDDLFNKTSKAYRKARSKIQDKFKDISDEEAEKYLDTALNENKYA